MEIIELVKEFVNPVISVIFALFIQIVKTLLLNIGIRFKRNDTWVWVVIIMGVPMALMDMSIMGFENFGIGRLIFMSVIHSSLSALCYKVGKKISGKSISQLFKDSGREK